MKKLLIEFLAVMCAVLMTGCSKTEYETVPYDSDKLIGTWMTVSCNGDLIPSADKKISAYKAGGVNTFACVVDGKWKEVTHNYTLNDGVIRYEGENSAYKILYLDDLSLTLKDVGTGDIYTSSKMIKDLSDIIVGTWDYPVDSEAPEQTFAFGSDGSFSETGDDAFEGHYHLYVNFLVLCDAAGNFKQSVLLIPDADNYGPLFTSREVDQDGVAETKAFAKRIDDYTVEDLTGTWIQKYKNGRFLYPSDLEVDKFDIVDGKCIENYSMKDPQDGGGYLWKDFEGSAYITRGKFLHCNYSNAKEIYGIVQLTDDSYSFKTTYAEGVTDAVAGDVYTASKITSPALTEKFAGTWTGTIYIDGADDINSTMTITNTNGKLTYSIVESPTRTVTGNIYLYGPELVVLEQTSPGKWVDLFYVSFDETGAYMTWNHWKITLYSDLSKVYDAAAIFEKS